MSTSTRDPVAAKSPAETPLYTPLDVARYLHLPIGGVLALTGRFRDWPPPEWFFHRFPWGFPHPFAQDDVLVFSHHHSEQERFTFRRFADVFVRAAAIQTLVELGKAGERSMDRWENLCRGIWRGLEDNWHAPDLFEVATVEERLERAIAPFARLDDEALAMLRKWLALRLERVTLEHGLPARLHPFSRDPAEASPRLIVLDPRIHFGRPTISDRGVPTDILFERHQAGDSITELGEDYSLPAGEIEEAIRYEAQRPVPLCPFFGW